MLKLLLIAALCTSSDAITPPKSKLSPTTTKTQAVHRGGGAMTETQATVSLFKTIVGGGILANWRQRFFVLEGSELFWYKSKEQLEMLYNELL